MELTDLPAQQNADSIEKLPRITIIGGTGNYGRALAYRFQEAELTFTIGSRQSNSCQQFGVDVLLYEEAIAASNVVFLTIPPHAYKDVVEPLVKVLVGKIVVDVSNVEKEISECNALRLKGMLPLSHVIKALNTVSAYTLENESYGASRDTFVCGDDNISKGKIMEILRQIALNPIDRGNLRSSVILEKLPLRFFPGWGRAVCITVVTLLPIWFYTYFHFFWYQSAKQIEKNKDDLALNHPNRIIAWTMFWVLSLTYLPGILAGFIQLYRGTKYLRFPEFLDKWMKCRKQLGLICLFLASIHGCMSCLLMGAGELKHAVENQRLLIPGQTVVVYQLMTAQNKAAIMFGVLALSLMSITGISSLPSVNARMSWLEWDFVQRGLGFGSLLFGFVHVIVYMGVLWDPSYKFGWKFWEKNPKGIFPSPAFLMPMLPLLVITLKILLSLPGLSCYLNRIRKGRVGYKYGSDNNSKPV